MTYSTVTGYPFDMNDDETEDEYTDRMIGDTYADEGPYLSHGRADDDGEVQT